MGLLKGCVFYGLGGRYRVIGIGSYRVCFFVSGGGVRVILIW